MTESDEGRPGGPPTPPADPASPGSEAKGADPTSAAPATSDAPAAMPPATAAPVPPTGPPPPSTPEPPAAVPAPTPAPAPEPPAAVPAPAPTPPPTASAPTPVTAAPAAAAAGPTYADEESDDDYFDDEFDGLVAPRWVGLATIAGAGIVAAIALQVLLVLVEGFSLDEAQRFAVPDDAFHRIGYPFGSLGSTTMFFLLLGVILLALPAMLGEDVTDRQYGIAGAAMRTAIALGVIVALGSVLAVRGSLHEYSAKDVVVPGYVKVQFISFLLATLTASALAVWGAITALGVRDEA